MFKDTSSEALDRLDLKANKVRQRMLNASQEMITNLWNQLDLSTIYHDWALEGQVVSPDELDAAFDSRAVTDANNLPISTIRSHKKAIDFAREVAVRKDLVFTPNLFREFHTLYASDPESAKMGRYRKEIPLHRSYFHEICHPDKISSNMRKLLEWLNDPEDTSNLHPIEWATEFHFRFMHIFPFAETSGKVGRTIMSSILIRNGYLPAIIHATERQRYYEAIRQSQEDLLMLIIESELSSLEAADKYLRSTAIAS